MEILLWWAASRALVLGVTALVQLLAWPAPHAPGLAAQPLAPLASWDAHWYRMVAERGYFLLAGHQSDPAFFPLLPVALRLLHLAGLPLDAAGILVENLSFLAALLALHALARCWLDAAAARRVAVYAAVFPFGFVFSMVYPEATVLAALALATLAAWRDRWLAAAAFAALATLGRPEGALVALPLLAHAARGWRGAGVRERTLRVAAVAAAPAALGAFSLYLWQTAGTPAAWTDAEAGWGRSFSPVGLYRAAAELATAASHHKTWLYRDAAFFVLYLVALALSLRARVPRSWVAAGALMVFLPLLSGTFNSDARFGLVALPVFFGLASLGRRRRVDLALRALSIAGLVALTATVPLHWP